MGLSNRRVVDELIAVLATTVKSRARVIHVAPRLALMLSGAIGWLIRDVMLTKDEINGLLANLLVSNDPPRGWTRLSEWLGSNADKIGSAYASELARHYR